MAGDLIVYQKHIIMKDERTNNQDRDRKDQNDFSRPDPETLHTSDPQENMEGPLSSTMHGAGAQFDTNETQQEADEERDEKI